MKYYILKYNWTEENNLKGWAYSIKNLSKCLTQISKEEIFDYVDKEYWGQEAVDEGGCWLMTKSDNHMFVSANNKREASIDIQDTVKDYSETQRRVNYEMNR